MTLTYQLVGLYQNFEPCMYASFGITGSQYVLYGRLGVARGCTEKTREQVKSMKRFTRSRDRYYPRQGRLCCVVVPSVRVNMIILIPKVLGLTS